MSQRKKVSYPQAINLNVSSKRRAVTRDCHSPFYFRIIGKFSGVSQSKLIHIEYATPIGNSYTVIGNYESNIIRSNIKKLKKKSYISHYKQHIMKQEARISSVS